MILDTPEKNPLYLAEDIERYEKKEQQSYERRDEFERDYGRIIHSFAFRRLQAKTQVLGIGESDWHRTRLTHSLEVASIARGLGIHLNANSRGLLGEGRIDTSLLEAAGLAHDLGNPPFGHKGEAALNELMVDYGGFEGNAQTFRILTALEGSQQAPVGLGLTRATLMAILKYPASYSMTVNRAAYQASPKPAKPPKFSYYDCDTDAFEWVCAQLAESDRTHYTKVVVSDGRHGRTEHVSLECSLMTLADDIAYATHDVEDALRFELIKPEQIMQGVPNLAEISPHAFSYLSSVADGHGGVRRVTAYLIQSLVTSTQLEKVDGIENPRLRWRVALPKDHIEMMNNLNELVWRHVITRHSVETLEWKGERMVRELFKAFAESPLRLLPEKTRKLYTAAQQSGHPSAPFRVICDHVSGMTDAYASRVYSRLFESRFQSVFERI